MSEMERAEAEIAMSLARLFRRCWIPGREPNPRAPELEQRVSNDWWASTTFVRYLRAVVREEGADVRSLDVGLPRKLWLVSGAGRVGIGVNIHEAYDRLMANLDECGPHPLWNWP